jgi:hypothetical protein
MSFIQRHMLRHAHPRHLIVGIVTMVWSSYFFWVNDLTTALAILIAGIIIARFVTLGMNEDRVANTLIGKILLLHLHPMNMFLQGIGFLLLMAGLWVHSAMYIMTAVSLILVGHMWGWHKVNEAL